MCVCVIPFVPFVDIYGLLITLKKCGVCQMTQLFVFRQSRYILTVVLTCIRLLLLLHNVKRENCNSQLFLPHCIHFCLLLNLLRGLVVTVSPVPTISYANDSMILKA